MSFSQTFRSSVVVAGAFLYAVMLSACAGGTGSQTAAQGAVPSLAQSSSDRTEQWSRYGHRHFAFGWMMRGLNLTDQQRAKLRQLMQQYRQAHPRESAFDPKARQQLHTQMLAVLTPQQRAQLKQNLQRMHHHWMANLNLSQQQRAQIHALFQQYRQTHPRGSAFDPQARKQLREHILSVLTPQQRVQLKQGFKDRSAS